MTCCKDASSFVFSLDRLASSLWAGCFVARKQVGKQYRRGFDSLVLLVGSMLWKEKNGRTQCIAASREEALQSGLSGFRRLRTLLELCAFDGCVSGLLLLFFSVSVALLHLFVSPSAVTSNYHCCLQL